MDKLMLFATSDPKDRRRNGADSLSDQLSSVHTFYLLVGFACIVQVGHLFGDKISCWVPAHFTGSHEAFTNNVCWTTSTYYLSFTERNMLKEGTEDYEDRRKIGYYQWVALILIFQAALFYIPRPLWRGLSKRSGIAVSTITDAAIDCMDQRNKEGRDNSIDYMVRHMSRFLTEIQRIHLTSRRCAKCWWELYGCYLNISYMFVKVIYLTNVIGQLYLLNAFLDTNFNFYGIDIIQKMSRGEEWTDPNRFPRVTLCDFKIRILGNIHRYTVQCSLPLNLFNEIIFIFVWFWFVVVAIVTSASLLSWIITLAIPKINRNFIKARLVAMEKIDQEGKLVLEDKDREQYAEENTKEDKGDSGEEMKEINTGDNRKMDHLRSISKTTGKQKPNYEHFFRTFLRMDGCFLIHMIKKNSSDLIAAEVIAGLWDVYIKNYRKFKGFNGNAYACSSPGEQETLLIRGKHDSNV